MDTIVGQHVSTLRYILAIFIVEGSLILFLFDFQTMTHDAPVPAVPHLALAPTAVVVRGRAE